MNCTRHFPLSFSLLLVMTSLYCISCQEKQNIEVKPFEPIGELSAEISVSAGDLFSVNENVFKVPTFFNVGRLDSFTYVLLLSKTVETGSRLDYSSIGMYTLEIDSTELAFIIGKPLDDALQLFSSNNFNEFSLEEIQFKALIDSWFKTNCEEFSCSNLSWQNDLKALRKLEQYQNNK